MRLRPLISIFFLLKLLVFTAAQAGGSESHGLERIWLNLAYEVAWVLDGKDQKYILPFLNEKKDRNNKNYDGNRGSGPDQKLEFKEFMDCLADKWPGTCTIDLTDDFNDVSNKLNKGGFGNALKIVQAKGLRYSKKEVEKNPFVYDYDVFIKDTTDMINKCRKEKGDSAIQEKLDKMRELAEKIVPIRDADFRQQKWITNDLYDTFLKIEKKDPVTGNDVEDKAASGKVIYEQISEGGTKVDDLTRPDFLATISDAKNKKLFKAKLNNSKTWRKDIMKWIDEYADNAWIENPKQGGGKVPSYPKRAQGHFKVLQAWKAVSEIGDRCVS